MKGVFLVLVMIGVLIVSLLIVKNLSTRQTLEGNAAQIKTMDHAKEAADLMNRQSEALEKELQRALQD